VIKEFSDQKASIISREIDMISGVWKGTRRSKPEQVETGMDNTKQK